MPLLCIVPPDPGFRGMASDTPTHASELGKVSDSQVATFVSTILHDLTMCSRTEIVEMRNLSTHLLDF